MNSSVTATMYSRTTCSRCRRWSHGTSWLTSPVNSPAFCVDEAVRLVARQVERCHTLGDDSVEELDARADETLHRAAVEAGESRELVLLAHVEPRDHEREDLRVLGANAVVRVRRQAELGAETPQDVGRASQLHRELLVGQGARVRFRQAQAGRECEVALLDSAGDVLERDAGFGERGHEPNDVDVHRREEPVVARLEEPELDEPVHVRGLGSGRARRAPRR